MTANRMNKEQFFAKLAPLDEHGLQKALWNLYWRGSASMRERIEAELEPDRRGRRSQAAKPEVDPEWVRHDVREFVELARAGAYMGGDRRVSPKERSRWRFTFQRLAKDAEEALRVDADGTGATDAMTELIDLACAMRDRYYFRSEDAVAAARFVVSDAAAGLWSAVQASHGFETFAERAAAQLLRWESPYGWTQHGSGTVGEKETTLAEVVERMLPTPQSWIDFADHYLDALDQAARDDATRPHHGRRPDGRERKERARRLAHWHHLLVDKLADYGEDERLDRLAGHSALGGPELTFIQARLAHRRGDVEGAHQLIYGSLEELPGAPQMQDFAAEVGAELPPRAQQSAEERARWRSTLVSSP